MKVLVPFLGFHKSKYSGAIDYQIEKFISNHDAPITLPLGAEGIYREAYEKAVRLFTNRERMYLYVMTDYIEHAPYNIFLGLVRPQDFYKEGMLCEMTAFDVDFMFHHINIEKLADAAREKGIDPSRLLVKPLESWNEIEVGVLLSCHCGMSDKDIDWDSFNRMLNEDVFSEACAYGIDTVKLAAYAKGIPRVVEEVMEEQRGLEGALDAQHREHMSATDFIK